MIFTFLAYLYIPTSQMEWGDYVVTAFKDENFTFTKIHELSTKMMSIMAVNVEPDIHSN